MSDKEVFKRIFQEFFKTTKKWIIYFFVVFWVFIWLISVLEPFFIQKIIDLVELFYKTGDFNFSDFYLILTLWIFFILFLAFLRIMYYYFIEIRIVKSYNDLFLRKTNESILMNYSNFLELPKWAFYKIFTRWIDDYLFFLEWIFRNIIEPLWLISFAIILSFFLNWKLALAMTIMLPLYFYMAYFYNKKTRTLQDNVNIFWDDSFEKTADWITNMWLVKTLNLDTNIYSFVRKKLNLAFKSQLIIITRWSYWEVQLQICVWISRFLVILLWVYLLINWEINIGVLILFFTLVNYIYYPLNFIFSTLKTMQKQIAWIKSMFELFDKIDTEKLNNWDINIKNIEWKIEFKNVWFWYNKNKKIFNNLNFKIKPWEKVAFVGNTWAGKSTIVNLLFRFWDINFWDILFDEIKINNITKKSLRKSIWLVMQDNSLFNDSIKNNLLFANSKATKKDIEKALKNAEANFVFDLKDGINTIIWERGLKLSGWEKQRLSIARLFLKNPKILVLDEATSALDNKTEKLVQKALEKLMKWRTSIVIAHRLSTIQNSDKIFMLENWKIVEEGKYDELMAKNWKFHELANPEHLIIN